MVRQKRRRRWRAKRGRGREREGRRRRLKGEHCANESTHSSTQARLDSELEFLLRLVVDVDVNARVGGDIGRGEGAVLAPVTVRKLEAIQEREGQRLIR